MGWRNTRKTCGPKLCDYILMLPILQSQNLNLLIMFVGQRSIFISMCLACILKNKGHVVMPEIVDGSYHLTNFYAV